MWKFCGKAQFRPKLCGNCALPRNFHTRKLGEITVFYTAEHIPKNELHFELQHLLDVRRLLEGEIFFSMNTHMQGTYFRLVFEVATIWLHPLILQARFRYIILRFFMFLQWLTIITTMSF